MDINSPTPESLQDAAAALGLTIEPRTGGGWTIRRDGYVVTWMATDYALAMWLALGGAPETQS